MPSPLHNVLTAVSVLPLPRQQEVLRLITPYLRLAEASVELVKDVWQTLRDLENGWSVRRGLYERIRNHSGSIEYQLSLDGFRFSDECRRNFIFGGRSLSDLCGNNLRMKLDLESLIRRSLSVPDGKKPKIVLVTDILPGDRDVLKAARLLDCLEKEGELLLLNPHPALQQNEVRPQYEATLTRTSFEPHTVRWRLGDEGLWPSLLELGADLIWFSPREADPNHVETFLADNLAIGGIAVLEQPYPMSASFRIVSPQNDPDSPHFCLQKIGSADTHRNAQDLSKIDRIEKKYAHLHLTEALEILERSSSHPSPASWAGNLCLLFDLSYGMRRTEGFPLYPPEEVQRHLARLFRALIQVNEEKKKDLNLEKLQAFLTRYELAPHLELPIHYHFLPEAEAAMLARRRISSTLVEYGFIAGQSRILDGEIGLASRFATLERLPDLGGIVTNAPWEMTPGQKVLHHQIREAHRQPSSLRAVFLPLSQVIPCRYLFSDLSPRNSNESRDKSLAGLNEIRKIILLRLAAMGWKREETPTDDMLWEALSHSHANSQISSPPLISTEGDGGYHLLLDVRDTEILAGFITLVGDGLLPAQSLQRLPWYLNESARPGALIQAAQQGGLPDLNFLHSLFLQAGIIAHLTEDDLRFSMETLMGFHEPSARALRDLGPFESLSVFTRERKKRR